MKKYAYSGMLMDTPDELAGLLDGEVVEVEVREPEPALPEVERCEVAVHTGMSGRLAYKRGNGRPMLLSCAVDDPDFIDYEDMDGRCMWGNARFTSRLGDDPARVPAAVLFRRAK